MIRPALAIINQGHAWQNRARDGMKYVAVGGLIEPCPHPMIEQAAAPSRTAPG
jgi:hypothetical protein